MAKENLAAKYRDAMDEEKRIKNKYREHVCGKTLSITQRVFESDARTVERYDQLIDHLHGAIELNNRLESLVNAISHSNDKGRKKEETKEEYQSDKTKNDLLKNKWIAWKDVPYILREQEREDGLPENQLTTDAAYQQRVRALVKSGDIEEKDVKKDGRGRVHKISKDALVEWMGELVYVPA